MIRSRERRGEEMENGQRVQAVIPMFAEDNGVLKRNG